MNPRTVTRVAALEARTASAASWPPGRTMTFDELESARGTDDRIGRILARVLPTVTRAWFEAQAWTTLVEQLDALNRHGRDDPARQEEPRVDR